MTEQGRSTGATTPAPRHTCEDDERGPRCSCGHYKSEHDALAYQLPGVGIITPAGSCTGAYATLMADADDHESVEVSCHCRGFWKADHEFEVR